MPCKRLEPHFVGAARRLAKNDPPVPLGTVNVPDNMELTKRFGLQQYPYLVMFRYGEVYNYTGPQEEDGNNNNNNNNIIIIITIIMTYA